MPLLPKILKTSLSCFLTLLILKFIVNCYENKDAQEKHLVNNNSYVQFLRFKYVEEGFINKILSYNVNLEEKKRDYECDQLFTPDLDTHILLNEPNSDDFQDYSGNLVIEDNANIVDVNDNDIKIKTDGKLNTLVFKDVLEDTNLFPHEPNIYDIKQGNIGDCWILAPLISICNSDSSIIKNSMKDLGNGYVIVRLYKKDLNGCTPCYYKIRKSIASEKPYMSTSSLWVQLLQKAIFMHMSILDSSNGQCYFDLQKSNLSKVMNVLLEEDINLLTFYSPYKPIFSDNCNKFIYKIIKKNIKDGIPVVAGTPPLDSDAGMISNHAYSVLGTGKTISTKNNKKNYYILLANPHGRNVTHYYYDNETIKHEIKKNGQHSGIMWAELNHFMNTFEQVSYQINKGSITNPANANEPLFYQTKNFGAYFIKLLCLRNDKNIIKATFEAKGLYKGYLNDRQICILPLKYFQLLYKDGSSEICHWNSSILIKNIILKDKSPSKFKIYFKINPYKEPYAIRFCVFGDLSLPSIYFCLNDLK